MNQSRHLPCCLLQYHDPGIMSSLFWILTCLPVFTHCLSGSYHATSSQYRYAEEPPDYFCPVDPPCRCDRNVRDFRVKRITCSSETSGQSQILFPQFTRRDRNSENEVLDKVSLIYADLREIPDSAFRNLQAVSLDLQGNDFQDRIQARAFLGVGKSLRSVSLAWSNISHLHPRVFRGMVYVRNLSLAENRIQRLPSETFQDLRSLERLSLAGNPLQDLPGDLFRYQTNVEFLDLGYCQLRHLPWSLFLGLWNLKVLDLRGNKLTALDSYTFLDLWSLHTLLLGHNPLRRLQTGVFYGLNHLVVLKLHASNIESVSARALRHMTHLRVLDLADNRIGTLPPGALLLPRLEHLNLDGNRLKDLPGDINYLNSLRSLDVSYNFITTIDSCSMERFKELDFLNLRQNPFICDCALFWLKRLRRVLMKKWNDHSQQIPFVGGRCAEPASLRGVGMTHWIDIACLRPSYGRATRKARRHAGTNTHSCRKDFSFYGNSLTSRERRIRHVPFEARHYYYDPVS